MKILAFFMAGLAIFAATAANATPTLVGLTNDPFGVDNIVVDGTTYDAILGTTALNLSAQESVVGLEAGATLASAAQLVGTFSSFVLRHGTNYHLEAANFTAAETIEAPEPLTLTLFGAGLAAVAAMRRRCRRGGAAPAQGEIASRPQIEVLVQTDCG